MKSGLADRDRRRPRRRHRPACQLEIGRDLDYRWPLRRGQGSARRLRIDGSAGPRPSARASRGEIPGRCGRRHLRNPRNLRAADVTRVATTRPCCSVRGRSSFARYLARAPARWPSRRGAPRRRRRRATAGPASRRPTVPAGGRAQRAMNPTPVNAEREVARSGNVYARVIQSDSSLSLRGAASARMWR